MSIRPEEPPKMDVLIALLLCGLFGSQDDGYLANGTTNLLSGRRLLSPVGPSAGIPKHREGW